VGLDSEAALTRDAAVFRVAFDPSEAHGWVVGDARAREMRGFAASRSPLPCRASVKALISGLRLRWRPARLGVSLGRPDGDHYLPTSRNLRVTRSKAMRAAAKAHISPFDESGRLLPWGAA
jgi:hypothetical protein